MNPGELFVLLLLVLVIRGIVVSRRHQPAPARAPADPDTERLRDEVRQLKERIQVLERVITDNHQGADLDRRIERLRDR